MSLTLVPNEDDGPPITLAQIAEMNFEAVQQIAGMSEEKRIEHFRRMAFQLAEVAWICGELVSRDKAAALKLVRENLDKYDPSLEVIEGAKQVAKEILEILTATHCRLFSCLAQIDAEGPNDDGDDGGDSVAA